MSEMHYDHDQDERDFFNKDVEKMEKGCMHFIQVFFSVIIILTLIIMAISCKSSIAPIALPYGPVISVDGDLVEVAHEVINKQKGSQIAAWYYVPGHGFVKGDIYPNFSKYRNPDIK